ncbi:MAG: LCP family protein [Tissierellia bacterium]|nr:LCP family protein [Tissierellia bacterium]
MKKRFLITFLVAVIIFSGSYIFFSKYLDILEAGSFKEVIKGVDLGEDNVIEQVVDHQLLFLLTGVDYNDPGMDQTRVRTDTLMLVKIDIDSGEIDLISLPRDTRVLVDGSYDKVNAAHAYGGMALTLRTIRDWLNIDLDYFVKLDFNAVEEIVDAIGGVEVEVPVQIDEEMTGIHIQPGRQKLNGKEALYFARFRAGYEDGDLGRVAAQQHLMKQIIKQTLSVENLPKIGDLMTTYAKRVDTNIPMKLMLSMIPSASNMDSDKIQSYRIPGYADYIDETSYFIYDEEGTESLIRELLPEYILQ